MTWFVCARQPKSLSCATLESGTSISPSRNMLPRGACEAPNEVAIDSTIERTLRTPTRLLMVSLLLPYLDGARTSSVPQPASTQLRCSQVGSTEVLEKMRRIRT